MISVEMKSENSKRFDNIDATIRSMFPQIEINGEKFCYDETIDKYFGTFTFSDDGCIGLEICTGIEDAQKNWFDDGDLYYLDEMTDDEIVKAMLEEIKL